MFIKKKEEVAFKYNPSDYEFILSDHYTFNFNGELFLHNCPTESRILIFTTRHNLDFMITDLVPEHFLYHPPFLTSYIHYARGVFRIVFVYYVLLPDKN